ncbi:hypothetical protein [Lactobacillus xylocopicola]|uniref:YxeA family protein n=1 Tax=Lactobacillus xylocopicola TaxID=2976676 RepID=A0ABM8BH44_9LACO|nr:hypothetical protein [Lactobacillus xylocopicola]BDR60602.1 hypothetical protein KIM322_08630 [Lactobacillus xylocopicola]
MLKDILITAYILLQIAVGRVAFDNYSVTDRIKQDLPETVSYAKVPKSNLDYRNVRIIDPATGKELPYRLKRVGGYDPSRQYIAIEHKGQYVRQIDYISKQKFLKAVDKSD